MSVPQEVPFLIALAETMTLDAARKSAITPGHDCGCLFRRMGGMADQAQVPGLSQIPLWLRMRTPDSVTALVIIDRGTVWTHSNAVCNESTFPSSTLEAILSCMQAVNSSTVTFSHVTCTTLDPESTGSCIPLLFHQPNGSDISTILPGETRFHRNNTPCLII